MPKNAAAYREGRLRSLREASRNVSARLTVSSATCMRSARRVVRRPQPKQASSCAGVVSPGAGWKSSQPHWSQRAVM